MTTIRLFRHHIDSAFVWLAVMELCLLFSAIYIGAGIRYQMNWVAVQGHIGDLGPRGLLFAVSHWLWFLAMGLYLPNLRDGLNGVAVRLALSLAFGTVTLALVYYLIPDGFVGRGALALSTFTAFVLLMAARILFYRIVGLDRLKSRVLVVGAGREAESICARMRRRNDKRNFYLLGFYPVAGETRIVDDSFLIKTEKNLCQMVIDLDVDEVVIAVDERRGCVPVDELLRCRLSGVSIVDIEQFFERESYKIVVDMLKPSHFIFSDGFTRNSITDRLRRIMDVVFSATLLIIFSPVMLITALAIKLEDGFRTPVFYQQVRVGAGDRSYNVLKFRSMIENAEAGGACWATKNDMRATRVGAFIRKYRIDELPQIFNVLRGEMAFVGPRPERPEFVSSLSRNIPFYSERHLVKPGITGWAQLNYSYGASENDAREKLQYDLYYIKNRSLLLDVLIIAQTVEVVLFGHGR